MNIQIPFLCSTSLCVSFGSISLGRIAVSLSMNIFSSVQSLSRIQLFATQWITAHQASLSITTSQSSLSFMSIESVMPSSHLILCYLLLFLPSVSPSIRVFFSETALCISWSKYWSFSFSISPPIDIQVWFPLGLTGWISLQSRDSQESCPTTLFKSINFSVLSLLWASLVAQLVKNPPAMWETWIRSLGWEDPLEKGKATHSSLLA